MIYVAASLARSAAKDDATSHWSFQPVIRPPIPSTGSARLTARNPIGCFIRARLAEHGLKPAPEADRRGLIRRLCFDLIGMPPTPEEVTAFIRDPRADAYEQLVDRLLASPHFGERWARHWLDVVRFAESHGFEMNQPRLNAWPYRDYVIRAFNEDKPYDRFVVEQIAGDVLGLEEATGFLVAGPWDQVKSPDEVLTRNQRADELHDIVNTTGTAFLGLTLGCARCHDHKFDPIPQRDYYAIKAIFEGVNHGERPRRDPRDNARRAEAEERKTRAAEIEAALLEFEPLAQSGPIIDTNRLRAPVHPRLNVERFAPATARRLRFTIQATTGIEPCIDELEVYLAVSDRGHPGRGGDDGSPVSENSRTVSVIETAPGWKPALRNVALASNGTRTRASGTYPNSEIHRLEHINDGKIGNSRSWISDENGKGWVELEFPEPVRIHRVVWGRDREEKFKDRLATEYRIEVALDTNDWKLVASSADRRPFRADQKFEPDYATNGQGAETLARLRSLTDELRLQHAKIKELSEEPKVYAGEFKQPEPTRRFHRGDPMQPVEVVEPGGLSFVGFKPGCLIISTNTPEQERRLALARGIASPDNPLTARVIVNRLWLYHFGEGLVSTPSDFGRNGAKPTHPELLDWLASELVGHNWSLKHIHRLIVTSATYRQTGVAQAFQPASSGDFPAARPDDGLESPRNPPTRMSALQSDSANRLLWHFPPHRLEAEALRDSILAVAGCLDLRMGGPGWSPFEPNDNYVRVYRPKQEFGPDDFRRMVYATVVRQRPDGVFGAFDCPDGGQIAPRRTRSTTPLQALNLLNSGFMMQAAGFFAERLERETESGAEAQVRRAFALAFQRQPSAEELRASAKLVREQGLNVFCRALFNANEFVYVY